MSTLNITFSGTVTVDSDEFVALLRTIAASGLTVTPTPTESPATVDTALGEDVEEVDDNPAAIAAAETLATSTGWTLDLAKSWVEELDLATQNGRLLHEVPIGAGGYATAAQMRAAAGRPETGPYAFTGFTGGVKKRFKRWSASTPGAAGLKMPVITDYDENIKWRQRAKGFYIEENIVPLFRIALAQTRD